MKLPDVVLDHLADCGVSLNDRDDWVDLRDGTEFGAQTFTVDSYQNERLGLYLDVCWVLEINVPIKKAKRLSINNVSLRARLPR